MEEIAPGIWHWSARHPGIRIVVHSYYLPEERVVLDPIEPEAGVDLLADLGPPEHVLLTNRHHYRSTALLVDRFGVAVHCARAGMHEFTDGEPVTPFEFGDKLPGGITAEEVGAICPDETAFHIPSRRALALADGAVRWEAGGPLAFVPDKFMDAPAETKRGLRHAYARLLERVDFDHLLLAHGEPFVGNGREALEAFVQQGRD